MDLFSLLSSLPLNRPASPDQPITSLLSSLSTLIGSCPDSALLSVASKVEPLFTTVDADWLLSTDEQELEPEYLSLSRALIGRCSLPLANDNVSSMAESQYESIGPRVEAVSPALVALLRMLGRNRAESGVSESVLFTVAPDVCVFAITHVQVAPWSNPSSRSAAQEVMQALLGAGKWTDSTHLLVGDGKDRQKGGAKGILGPILDLLQPQLSEESLFCSDAVKLVFSWALLQVTRPALSDHLSRLLPPSLLLTDHYRPENCILGVRCLHHIVLHTKGAELRQLNRAEVLYHALSRLLYQTHALVSQCVLSCLMDLLLVLEKPPSRPSPSHSRRASSRHDNVLQLVLTQMEAEQKLDLRRVYTSVLPPLVNRCGIAVCKHLKRLERVIIGYLEISDPPEETSRVQVLLTLERTLQTAWPRVDQRRAQQILRAVLRLLVDVSSDVTLKDSVKQEIFDLSAVCIRLLDACSHGTLQCLLLQVDNSHCSPDVIQVLRSATTQTPT